jgi:hypothetical protein
VTARFVCFYVKALTLPVIVVLNVADGGTRYVIIITAGKTSVTVRLYSVLLHA